MPQNQLTAVPSRHIESMSSHGYLAMIMYRVLLGSQPSRSTTPSPTKHHTPATDAVRHANQHTQTTKYTQPHQSTNHKTIQTSYTMLPSVPLLGVWTVKKGEGEEKRGKRKESVGSPGYLTRAMYPVLLGSYSSRSTTPSTPSRRRVKSTSRSRRL